jgi:hypothetical protein
MSQFLLFATFHLLREFERLAAASSNAIILFKWWRKHYSLVEMKTVEAVIGTNGEVRLLEPLELASPSRALVTILEEAPAPLETALLSEAALAEDWNRREEDAAWAHLQPGKSS